MPHLGQVVRVCVRESPAAFQELWNNCSGPFPPTFPMCLQTYGYMGNILTLGIANNSKGTMVLSILLVLLLLTYIL